jgi:hypothetical protein
MKSVRPCAAFIPVLLGAVLATSGWFLAGAVQAQAPARGAAVAIDPDDNGGVV